MSILKCIESSFLLFNISVLKCVKFTWRWLLFCFLSKT